jgi:hypothetical protein
MVNTLINVSAYQGAPPDDLDTNKASRKILGGPIYDKDDILKVLEGGEDAISPWTKKCISDLKKYEISHDEVENYIRIALASGKFKGSEWCKGKKDGVYAACDSYQILVKEWVPAAHKEMTFEYYVKFAIGKLGNLMLIISCHPPEDRR